MQLQTTELEGGKSRVARKEKFTVQTLNSKVAPAKFSGIACSVCPRVPRSNLASYSGFASAMNLSIAAILSSKTAQKMANFDMPTLKQP